MDTQISLFENKSSFEVGRVFTPIKWARWALEKYNIYDKWRSGCTIIEPTCGSGVFFRALLSIAKDNNESVSISDLNRLTGVEINKSDKQNFMKMIQEDFGLEFPECNFISCDFLDYFDARQFDIAIGNPPWSNFTEIPEHYKEKIKNNFLKYDLVKNKKDVLLGASRADIAALIIQKTMKKHVKIKGEGFFFVPMSLFFNEDANKNFRPREGSGNVFSVEEIVDFENGLVFEDVGTRNGFIHLKSNDFQNFPIPIQKYNGEKLWCRASLEDGAWMRMQDKNNKPIFEKIQINETQVARQGINTGGLNKVFLLERSELLKDDKIAEFQNGYGETIELETDYVFPIMHVGLFSDRKPKKFRYILCLHYKNGAALSSDCIEKMPLVKRYIETYRVEMTKRKGTILQAHISRGYFWHLFGVGAYSFSQYKVAWEALGKREFKSVVIDGIWQGNSAMHAYIPAATKEDAQRISYELNESVPAYLNMFGMNGTCNWAQPGRIKRLLSDGSDMRLL